VLPKLDPIINKHKNFDNHNVWNSLGSALSCNNQTLDMGSNFVSTTYCVNRFVFPSVRVIRVHAGLATGEFSS
jgi:hypothetical protein